jgi:hypothetical protein
MVADAGAPTPRGGSTRNKDLATALSIGAASERKETRSLALLGWLSDG